MKKIIVLLLLLASNAFAQTVAKDVRWITAEETDDGTSWGAIDVTVADYEANDVVGGLLRFSGVLCSKSKSGRVGDAIVTDKAGNQDAYTLHLFSSQPTGTFTDEGAATLADASLAFLVPHVTLESTDCKAFADNGYCSLSSLRSGARTTATNSNNQGILYGLLITDGTPTYASTSDVDVRISVECD